jgi:hypothetical protein
MTAHLAPLPFLRSHRRPLAERPGPWVAVALVGLALVVMGTGAVQAAQAAHDAQQRDQLVQVVERACAQERLPADVCAAGRVADE